MMYKKKNIKKKLECKTNSDAVIDTSQISKKLKNSVLLYADEYQLPYHIAGMVDINKQKDIHETVYIRHTFHCPKCKSKILFDEFMALYCEYYEKEYSEKRVREIWNKHKGFR